MTIVQTDLQLPAPTVSPVDPWHGFDRVRGANASTCATSSSATTRPTTATPASWPGRPPAPRGCGGSSPRCSRASASCGVYDIDTHTPGTITSHGPGYIDRDLELVVGLQTDAPLKRAMMPNGGWRMVKDALAAYGYDADPRVEEIFTKYRKTHNDGVFDAYTPADPRRPEVRPDHRPARRLRPRPDHRRLPAGAALRRRGAHRGQAGRPPRPGRPPLRPRRSSGPARSSPSRSGRCRT